MALQKIKFLKDENDVFSYTTKNLNVRDGDRILSDAPYVEELYAKYIGASVEVNNIEPRDGDMVDARIIKVSDNNINLDINSKYSATLNLKKENSKYHEYLTEGSIIKVKLQRRNKEFLASITDAFNQQKFNEIRESIGKPIAFKAKVNELLYGGYWLTIDGIKVFMPGSLAGMNKLYNFESLIGKEIAVMPINYSAEKDTIVVSHREYLRTILPVRVSEVKTNITQKYSGFVTGTTQYGIFVEFNECVTALIPTTELDEKTNKLFINSQIKPGDTLEFFIKDVINDNKIIASQIKDNVWTNIQDKLKPKQETSGKITMIKSYGAFIELECGINVLLSNTEYQKDTIKVGDIIQVIIQKIDIDNKKVIIKRK